MSKSLYIAEKPSVANEFAKALKENYSKYDGYLESDKSVVTWCVGHLVTMSYPEAYDPALAKWSLNTIPFIPDEFKYEVIDSVSKQFRIVKGLLNRQDVTRIYVCTDSGREGEYIYRLVDTMAGVPDTKDKRRVWIDSQTEEEVLRGIREAKPISAYDNLASAAYLRAKEDYLMGINFSRVLTLKYGYPVRQFLHIEKGGAISVGRVMTCVLGMVVRREREIRAFKGTPFYRVIAGLTLDGVPIPGEFKAVRGSKYFETPYMYKENGFKELATAQKMISEVLGESLPDRPGQMQTAPAADSSAASAVTASSAPTVNDSSASTVNASADSNANGSAASAVTGPAAGQDRIYTPLFNRDTDTEPSGYRTVCDPAAEGEISSIEKKKETKNAPLLFNLAELQNECSKRFKISPDETLNITQELYEKKLVTYPRTDARVLSTAVAKVIDSNIRGLKGIGQFHEFAEEILDKGWYKGLAKTKYVNDKQITDHYAIIPTGQGFQNLKDLKPLAARVYELIGRRFLSIFFPPAVYRKVSLTVRIGDEFFFAGFRALMEEGWYKVSGYKPGKPGDSADGGSKAAGAGSADPSVSSGSSGAAGNPDGSEGDPGSPDGSGQGEDGAEEQQELGIDMLDKLEALKKGSRLPVGDFTIRMGATSAPKRYNSGSMILAMENAGQLIEDEELRAQIKGSGIGTSATRAEILNKLVKINYLALNRKTQIITPTLQGEMIYEVVNASIRSLLNPELTASWEKGLTGVAEGNISEKEYMDKLKAFVTGKTEAVKRDNYTGILQNNFSVAAGFYNVSKESGGAGKAAGRKTRGR